MTAQAGELTPLPANLVLAADVHLAAPERRPPRNRWAWALALALHALVIAILLFVHERAPVQEAQSPPGISVVFDHGGANETTAPPAARHGPPALAQSPPPPPPPQTQMAKTAPNPLPAMPQTPKATLHAAPKPAPKQASPAPHPPQRYVMLNGMSYGNISPVMPAPPSRHKGLNLSLPQSDAQAVTAPDFTVHGNVGADWDAALTKWVNEHAYYPRAAIEQNQQGTAEVQFTVDRNGHVTNIHLKRSAGSPFLDQAWIQLFADNQLPPFPPGSKAKHATVDYTVHYQLIP